MDPIYLFSSFGFGPVVTIVLIVWLIILQSRVSALTRLIEGGAKPQKAPVVTPETKAELDWIAPTPKFVAPVAKPISTVSGEELGGRWLGKIGVIALVIGISFFLKYAFDNQWIGEIGRVMIGLIAGVVLIGIGQYVRKKYLVYSDILSGGGIAVLYLSIFAAFSFYHLIGQIPAFGLMIVVTALSIALSVAGGTIHLALLGVLGGFLTPLLISTGQNNLFGLFGYIAILDVGILGVTLFKKWPVLNYLGFIGTWILYWIWAMQFYTSSQLFPTWLFLTIFFAVYLFSTIAHHITRKEETNAADLILIVANAGLYFYTIFGIFAPLYRDYLGFYAAMIAVVYLIVAMVGYRANPKDRRLNLFLPALATLFITIAVPLQFTGAWITFAWLVEALLLYAFAFFGHYPAARKGAAVVYIIGIFRLLITEGAVGSLTAYTMVFNERVFLFIVAILVAYAIAWWYKQYVGSDDPAKAAARSMMIVLLVVAQLLSLFILTSETATYFEKKLATESEQFQALEEAQSAYRGTATDYQIEEYQVRSDQYYGLRSSFHNQRNTVISIIWALYAVLLMVIGFALHTRWSRIFGLVLFFLTAFKVFIDVWSLGPLYRIISSISIGVIALAASFIYAKYKDKLRQII